MGGVGSGRPKGFSGQTCDSMHSIDLAYLNKHNLLQPGRTYTLRWSLRGEESGWIKYQAFQEKIILKYCTRSYGETDWIDIELPVWFDTTPAHFGGWRKWFLCPCCSSRRRVIYGGSYFYCRACHGLSYATQSEAAWERGLSVAQTLRTRLGGSGSLDEPFPVKPKGMHWKSYYRMVARDDGAIRRYSFLMKKWFNLDKLR